MKLFFLILLFILTITNFCFDLKMEMVIHFNLSFQFAFWITQIVALIFVCLIGWIVRSIFNNHKLKNTLSFGISSIYLVSTLLLFVNNLSLYKDNSYNVNLEEYPFEKLPNYETESTYVFLLPSCEHCIHTAQRINKLYENNKISNITLVLYAREVTAEKFVTSHNLTVPFINIDNDDFFDLSGSEYPTIISYDTISIKVWTGQDVNFGALDNLLLH